MSLPGRIHARLRDLQGFQELGGPVIRTHPLLERVFPDVIWRYQTSSPGSPIHLTFDDGPSEGGTLRVLDVLARHDVKASFFVTGSSLYGHETVLRQIREAGHTIGYHGMTHDAWWMRARFRRDLEMNPDRIPLLEYNPFAEEIEQLLLRAPYGRIDFATMYTARELDAQLIHWSLTVRDWTADLSSTTLARALYRFVQPGDIVLLHDDGPSVTELVHALDRVIPLWKDSGMIVSSIQPFINARTA